MNKYYVKSLCINVFTILFLVVCVVGGFYILEYFKVAEWLSKDGNIEKLIQYLVYIPVVVILTYQIGMFIEMFFEKVKKDAIEMEKTEIIKHESNINKLEDEK